MYLHRTFSALSFAGVRESALLEHHEHSTGQSMILFSGYSTMPDAPPAFNLGTMSRTIASSMIVFTSTQLGSERAEIVGVWRAGRMESTRSSAALGTFIIRPTLPAA